jgi:hypothetical protein
VSYIVLNPHSETNPSAMFRVVEFDAWRAYADREVSHLDVKDEATTYAEALQKSIALNTSAG